MPDGSTASIVSEKRAESGERSAMTMRENTERSIATSRNATVSMRPEERSRTTQGIALNGLLCRPWLLFRQNRTVYGAILLIVMMLLFYTQKEAGSRHSLTSDFQLPPSNLFRCV